MVPSQYSPGSFLRGCSLGEVSCALPTLALPGTQLLGHLFFFLLNLNLIGPQLWSLLYDPVFGVLISQDNGEECSLAWVELAALFGFFRGTVLPCGLCFPEFQRSP